MGRSAELAATNIAFPDKPARAPRAMRSPPANSIEASCDPIPVPEPSGAKLCHARTCIATGRSAPRALPRAIRKVCRCEPNNFRSHDQGPANATTSADLRSNRLGCPQARRRLCSTGQERNSRRSLGKYVVMSEADPVITLKRRYVYEDVDRWGNVRIYFWRGRGQRKVRCTENPGTEAFDNAYHDWLKQSEVGEFKPAPSGAPKQGTFRWLATEYFKSVSFTQLDPRTQRVTQLIVEKCFLEQIAPGAQELFGDCPLEHFSARAVRILRDRHKDRPEAANNRVRRLRRIFHWALEEGLVNTNPVRDVPLLRPTRVGGFPTWSPADIEQFEQYHPVGSKARLALAPCSIPACVAPMWCR